MTGPSFPGPYTAFSLLIDLDNSVNEEYLSFLSLEKTLLSTFLISSFIKLENSNESFRYFFNFIIEFGSLISSVSSL